MASMRDIMPVVREIGFWELLKRVWNETMDDHVFVYASALSYSWLFAFFPMLIFLVSLIPFLPESARHSAERLITRSIEHNFPEQTADWILQNSKLKSVIETTLHDRRGTVLSVSLVIALYAASKGISAVMTAMDRCYEIDKGRPFYRSIPLSLLLTVVLTALMLVVMTLLPIGTLARNMILARGLTIPFTDYQLTEWTIVAFDLVRYAIGLTAAFFVLSLVYNFCPSVKMRWQMLSPGSFFCFFAWVAIGLAFRYYLKFTGGSTYSQTFGPAAGLAMLLLIFYLYGAVLLIGAEINSEIDYVRLKVKPGTTDLRPAQKALVDERRARRRGRSIPRPAAAGASADAAAPEKPL